MLSNWKLLSDKLEDWHGLTGLTALPLLSNRSFVSARAINNLNLPVNIKQLFITLHCFIRPTTSITYHHFYYHHSTLQDTIDIIDKSIYMVCIKKII